MISLTILTHEAATPLLKKEGIKTGSRIFDILKKKDVYVVNPFMERYIKAWNYECHFSSSVPAAFDGSSKPQGTRFTCRGVTDQCSTACPHSVSTKGALLRISGLITSDVWFGISIPISFIFFTALGFKA